MIKHKLMLKKSYEDRIQYPPLPFLFGNGPTSGIHLNTILDFSKPFESTRISAGTFIIDFTTIWYNQAGLSSSGSIRCTAVFTGRNLDQDAPGDHSGREPTTVDPGFLTPSIRLVEQNCVYWPSCSCSIPNCFGWGMSEYVFWYQNSKDPTADPATGASVKPIMPGVDEEVFNADRICFAIQRGALQADGHQDFFTTVEVFLYEPPPP
jgi:hypothetical protein